MSSDEAAEDSGHVSFIRMRAEDTFDGQDRVISQAAYDLHIRATSHSAFCGHPGLVPDQYLAGLGPRTTIAAAELCTVGIWECIDGSYRVLDQEAVQVCVDHVDELRPQDNQAPAREQEHPARTSRDAQGFPGARQAR